MYRAAWPSGKLSKCVRWTVGHSWVWRTSLNNGTLSTFCRISVGPAQARVLPMEISGSVWLVWTGRVQGNTPAILPVQICTNGQMKVYLSTGVWIRCSPPTVYCLCWAQNIHYHLYILVQQELVLRWAVLWRGGMCSDVPPAHRSGWSRRTVSLSVERRQVQHEAQFHLQVRARYGTTAWKWQHSLEIV